MPAKTPFRLMVVFSAISLAAIVGAVAYRTWPRPLPYSLPSALPFVSPRGDHLAIQYPAPVVIARVGDYQDELLAYLHFEYLRSRSIVDEPRVLLTVRETPEGPRYQLQLAVENNLLATVPYLADLAAQDFIPYFHLYTTTTGQYAYLQAQTQLFVAAYNLPVRQKLETMSPGELVSPVARFLFFKSSIDPRVRQPGTLSVKSLSSEQATQMAADIVAVASFYHLPLDFFLGIGAMENNYLSVDGDLEHAVWKKHAAKGDTVLQRRRGRVLVRNYSIGAWQITRETLRYAHALYLRDKRDYSVLPERLRPPATLDLDAIDQHVLTTYAGLLFRDLLDRFDGDVQKAVGAYNGGVKNPNREYSEGVGTVANYARKILEQVVAQSGQSVAHVEFAMKKAPQASKSAGNQNQPPTDHPESIDP